MKSYRKYGNIKAVVDGIHFDSRKEAARYQELVLLEKAGQIVSLRLQPRYKIVIGGVAVKYPSGRQMVYIADFDYIHPATSEIVIEDVKGMRTDKYKIKQALMLAMGFEIIEI